MNLEDSFIPEFELPLAEFATASSEEPFMHAGFELLKESTAYLAAAVGLRRTGEKGGLPHRQAIVVALMARLVSLGHSLVRQLSDQHGGELQIVISRQVIETAATHHYLLGDEGDGSRFEAFVKDSLVTEREFLGEVERQIARRGSELPIETRIKRSIDATFASAGLTPADIPSRRRIGWPNAEERVSALSPTAYVAFRTGSGAVHSSYSSVEKDYMEKKGDLFEVSIRPIAFRPQMALTVARLLLDVGREYVQKFYPDGVTSFGPRYASIRKRLDSTDAAHETYLGP